MTWWTKVWTMTCLYLVSCVSMKLPNAAPAKDLYTSPWFKKARAWVEARVDDEGWAILSAGHGLVHPRTVLRPYNKTMGELRAAGRPRRSLPAWSGAPDGSR